LALEIEASSQVHANRRDDVFLRVGDENRKLTYSQRQELVDEKGLASFEATGVPGTGVSARTLSRSDLSQQRTILISS